jgi:pantoate--beta-alanine ligase
VGAVAQPLEGAARPGHSDGVATVVAILFNLVGAEHAYFGQKDAQQVMVIRRMALDIAIQTEVIACPTVREADGLAMSSRNAYLTPEQRQQAVTLSSALRAGAAAAPGGPDAVLAAAHDVVASESGVDLDYLALAGADLGPVVAGDEARLLIAARVGTTRLIDNLSLTPTNATGGN